MEMMGTLMYDSIGRIRIYGDDGRWYLFAGASAPMMHEMIGSKIRFFSAEYDITLNIAFRVRFIDQETVEQ
jgi:hypothetical protein